MELTVFSEYNSSLALPKSASEAVIAGTLSKNTARAYASDIKHFMAFIGGEDRLREVTKDIVTIYRNNLMEQYKPATVNRKMSSVRQLLDEAVERGLLKLNPATKVKGIKLNNNYSPTPGMTKDEIRQVLARIDKTTLIGLRDYALWLLMLKTGLRRGEVATLRVSSLSERDGYKILTVVGKGNKTRIVKLPTDVFRALDEWLQKASLTASDSPLFTAVRKKGRGKDAEYHITGTKPMTGDGVCYLQKNQRGRIKR